MPEVSRRSGAVLRRKDGNSNVGLQTGEGNPNEIPSFEGFSLVKAANTANGRVIPEGYGGAWSAPGPVL